MSKYEVTSCLAATDDAVVELFAPSYMVEQMAVLLEPFVRLYARRTLSQCWKIRLVESVVVYSGASSYHVFSGEGEPRQEVLVDTPDRLVSVSCDDKTFAPLLLTRILSHLLRIESLSAEHQFMHAAAISSGAGSLVLAGDKKSGKTTLTMEMIRRYGVGFISNDNVSIKYHDGRWASYGWPRSLRIRTDMLDVLKLSTESGRETKIVLSHPLNKGLALPCDKAQSLPPVLHIFPFELKGMYGTPVIASQPLQALVYLNGAVGSEEPSLSLMSDSEAEHLYRKYSFPTIEIPGMSHAPFLKHLIMAHEDVRATVPTQAVPCYFLNNGLNNVPKACDLLNKLFIS